MSHATQRSEAPLYTVAGEENPKGMPPGTYYFVRHWSGVRVSGYFKTAAMADAACPRPCRSPYCECEQGKCTHPGCYDARGVKGRAHVLYTDADKDRPDVICDGNGQVVLDLCKVCGKAEVELLDSPECPGNAGVPVARGETP